MKSSQGHKSREQTEVAKRSWSSYRRTEKKEGI